MLSGLEGKFQDHPGGGEPGEGKEEAAAAEQEEQGGREGEEGAKGEGGEGEGKEDEGGEEEAEEEEAEQKPVIEIRTSAYDARFPSTNQVPFLYDPLLLMQRQAQQPAPADAHITNLPPATVHAAACALAVGLLLPTPRQ
jgi:hypothetical protein